MRTEEKAEQQRNSSLPLYLLHPSLPLPDSCQCLVGGLLRRCGPGGRNLDSHLRRRDRRQRHFRRPKRRHRRWPHCSRPLRRNAQYLEGKGHHNAVIDTLICTHAHDDRYPGAEGIRHFEVQNYFDPGCASGSSAYSAVLNEVRCASVNGHTVKVMLGRKNFEPLDWSRIPNIIRCEDWHGSPCNSKFQISWSAVGKRRIV